MSAASLQDLQFIAGSLCINPTDKNTAFPHGGTALGYVKECMVFPAQVNVLIRAEEWGPVVVEGIEAGRAYVIGCILQGHNDDAINTIFPSATTGSSSGKKGIAETTSTPRSGSKLSDRSVKLLFSPDDPIRHEMVLLPKALPMLDAAAELNLSLRDPLAIAVVFCAIPDATGRLFNMQLLEDITL